MTKFILERVYATPDLIDGTRILVDRPWPRGIARDRTRIDLWLKATAPSNALRKRFRGHPDEWDAFRTEYFAELDDAAAREATTVISERSRTGPVTLLHAARDEQWKNAVALEMWLDRQSNQMGTVKD